MQEDIDQYKRSLLEAGLSGETGGISQVRQSPLERFAGSAGEGLVGIGNKLQGKLESESHPILSAIGQAVISDPFQTAGSALQDWSGTPREYTEDQPYNAAPITGGRTLQTMKFDPRIVEVAGFAQPIASMVGKTGKAVASMGIKGSTKAAGEAINQGHGTVTRAQPRSSNYATEQQGAFYRVRPHSTSAGSSRGLKEQEGWDGTTGADTGATGRSGYGVPQLLPHEEVARIIATPEENLPLQIAQEYTKAKRGVDFNVGNYPPSSLAKQSAIGRAFMLGADDVPGYKQTVFNAYLQKMPEVIEEAGARSYDDLMEKAYKQLAVETDQQFRALPYNFSFHKAGEGNYASSKEMAADVHGNRHLYVFQGGDKHDYLHNVDPETGLNENEKFRAVHDLLGHAVLGNEFGPKGEEAAYIIHQQMYSPLARLAMAAETRGQNSVVNYSPLNAELKHNIAQLDREIVNAKYQGNADEVKRLQGEKKSLYEGFQFAPQKSVLLPPEMLDANYTGGMPEYMQGLIQPRAGSRSALTHYSNVPDLKETDPTRFGSGIKGSEKHRLSETTNPVKERSYFYAGEPGEVAPEPGLGRHAYRTESEKLYDIASDPEKLLLLSREANRTPYTSKYNAGLVDQPQSSTDLERIIKEYGYEGMLNPNAAKPMAVMFGKKPVQKMAKGGLVDDEPTLDTQKMSLLEAALMNANRSGNAQATPSMLERARKSIGQGMSEWAQGVKHRTAHPVEAFASEARRWKDMPPEEMLGQFGGSGLAGVVKGKGGNWVPDNLPEHIRNIVGSSENAVHPREQALAKWIKGPMTKYIKQEIGTPEDPIRKLAEQGIVHTTPWPGQTRNQFMLKMNREAGGYPEPMGVSEQAKAWEDVADSIITGSKVDDLIKNVPDLVEKNPWIKGLHPESRVYDINSVMGDPNAMGKLGMYRIKDMLRTEMEEGRLRPENLNAIRMEDAVKRVYERDQFLGRQHEKTPAERMAENLGYKTSKVYPSGHRWVELPDVKTPEGIAKVQEIGCQGGWCTNELDNALSFGDQAAGNRLHVLIDKEGRPHIKAHTQEMWQGEKDLGGTRLNQMRPFGNSWESQRVQDWVEKNPAYKRELIPMMQDFIRSGNFAEVDDLHHADLYNPKSVFKESEHALLQGENPDLPRYMTMQQVNEARRSLDKPQYVAPDVDMSFLDDVVPPQGMAVGGIVKGFKTMMKASEALGQHEGKTLMVTQADRTKVGGGHLGLQSQGYKDGGIVGNKAGGGIVRALAKMAAKDAEKNKVQWKTLDSVQNPAGTAYSPVNKYKDDPDFNTRNQQAPQSEMAGSEVYEAIKRRQELEEAAKRGAYKKAMDEAILKDRASRSTGDYNGPSRIHGKAKGGRIKFSTSKELNPSKDTMKLATMRNKLTKAR